MPIPSRYWSRVAGTPATPQFAEVIYKSKITESDGSTQDLLQILHFLRTGGPGTTTENDLYNAVTAVLGLAQLAPAWPNDVTNNAVTVRFMDDPTRPAVIGAALGNGTAGAARAASFVNVTIRKTGFARGRSYKGSNHWGPPGETNYVNDELNGAGLANWGIVQAALASLATGVLAGGLDFWQLAVFSPTLSDYISNPISVTGTLVNQTILNAKLGTMKRRKEGVGT